MELRDRLRRALLGLHPRPAALRHDPELLSVVAALYNTSDDRIWTEHLEPFLGENAEALHLLYQEHLALPEAKLLDLIEAPMLLERLDNDSARLEATWPLDRASLLVLADAWGRPLYHAA